MATAVQTTEIAALGSFARATLDLLTFWPALRIAVQQGGGGPTEITHLAEDIVDAFYSAATSQHPEDGRAPPVPSLDNLVLPETDDIEDVLLHNLSHAFRLTLEDGSERIVAKDLVTLWKESIARALNPAGPHAPGAIEKFAAAAAKAKAEDGVRTYEVQRQGESDDDEEDSGSDDEMDEDVEMGDEHEHGPGCSHSHAAPPPRRQEPEIDEDGFQMVPKKGGRR